MTSRFVQDIRETLVPARPHHSLLGWTVATQRLEALFPMWRVDFQNSQVQLRQKDLMSQAEDMSHRDFEGLLPPQEQLRLRCFTGCWVDGWVRCIPSLAFVNYLSNVTFSDSISMRLGLLLFDTDETCLQYPQISDQYGHHNLMYIMIGKMGLHNCIHDEVYRLLSRDLGLKFEPLGLLSDEPDRRPTDFLTIPSTLC